MPSEDPTKTSNVTEMALKYIMGRTGQLLLTVSSHRYALMSVVKSTTNTKHLSMTE